MTFLSDLRAELAARGIRGRLADRIEAELADHLACDRDARLGEPAEIAERFAVELRGVRTRRASVFTFAALAFTALLLGLSTPRQVSGDPWAGLLIAACAQIAFVAGSLALLRSFRGRTDGDFHLAQRRATVALVAGVGVAAGLAAEARLLTVALALAALAPLAAAAVANRRAAALTPRADARGLTGDFGPHAALVLCALGAVAVGGIVFQGVVFEGSGWEGIIRGAIEGAGLATSVAVLGRVLGLRVSA